MFLLFLRFGDFIIFVVEIENLASIGDYAFYGCTGLTDLTLPANLATLGASAFRNCTGLTNVAMSDGSIVSISDYAFYGCTDLSSITIPDGLVSIGSYAFYKCTSLTDIIIPDSTATIGERAFYGCTGLTDAVLSGNLASIGDYAFYSCTSLTDLTLSDNLSSIGSYAFSRCKSLSSITIPESVTTFGSSIFTYSGLKKVYCYEDSAAADTSLYPIGTSIYYLSSDSGEPVLAVDGSLYAYTFVVDRDMAEGMAEGETLNISSVTMTALQALSLNEGSTDSEIGSFTYTYSLKSNGVNTSVIVDGASAANYRMHSSYTASEDCTITIATKLPSGKKVSAAIFNEDGTYSSLFYSNGTAAAYADRTEGTIGNAEIKVSLAAGETLYLMGSGTNIEVYAVNVTAGISAVSSSSITTETSTETTTEAVTLSVEVGAAVTADSGTANGDGTITYQTNDDGTISIIDTDTGATGTVSFPVTNAGTIGKVTVTGSFTLDEVKNSWTLVQIKDVDSHAITDIRTNGGYYSLRYQGTVVAVTEEAVAAGDVSYEIIIDYDAKTISLSVNGCTPVLYSTSSSINEVAEIRYVTASGSRNLLNISTPVVTVETAETTTESTTEISTEASTETTTEESAAGTAKLSVSDESTGDSEITLAVGETKTVDIDLTDISEDTPVNNITFYVTYDPAVAVVKSAEMITADGTLSATAGADLDYVIVSSLIGTDGYYTADMIGKTAFEAGIIKAAYISGDYTDSSVTSLCTFSDDTTLLKLTFEGAAAGSTDVKLDVVDCNNIPDLTNTVESRAISVETSDAVITVTGSGGSAETTTEAETEESTEAEDTTEAAETVPISGVVFTPDPQTDYNYYTVSDDGTYNVYDYSSSVVSDTSDGTSTTSTLIFSFSDIGTSGVVTVSGVFTPSSSSSKWAIAALVNAKDKTIASAATDRNKYFTLRDSDDIYYYDTNGSSSDGTTANTPTVSSYLTETASSETSYTFTVDYDNLTVGLSLTVGEQTNTYSFTADSLDEIAGIKFITSGSAARNITGISVPTVSVASGGSSTDPETSEATTEETTETTTEAETESTTETTTEEETESTTEDFGSSDTYSETSAGSYAIGDVIYTSANMTVTAADTLTVKAVNDVFAICGAGTESVRFTSSDGDTVRPIYKIDVLTPGTLTVTADINPGKKLVLVKDDSSYAVVTSYKNEGTDKIEGYELSASVEAGIYYFGGVGTNVYTYSVSLTTGSGSGSSSSSSEETTEADTEATTEEYTETTTEAAVVDDSASQIKVSAPENAKLGNTVEVKLIMRNVDVISGGQFVLNYDNTKVSLDSDSCSAGAVLTDNGITPVVNADNDAGTCAVAFISNPTTNFDAEGTIMTFTFTTIAEGTAEFSISDLSFSYKSGTKYIELDIASAADSTNITNYILGDVNDDNKINYLDAVVILRSVVGLVTLDETHQLAADVDGNGYVNYQDAMYILDYSAGNITSFSDL